MKNTTLTLLATTILSAVTMQAQAAPLKEPEAQFLSREILDRRQRRNTRRLRCAE